MFERGILYAHIEVLEQVNFRLYTHICALASQAQGIAISTTAHHNLSDLILRYITQLNLLDCDCLTGRPIECTYRKRAIPNLQYFVIATPHTRVQDSRYTCPNAPLPNESPNCYAYTSIRQVRQGYLG